jgi:glycosyltransferase involved in cell wall biosynthesis
VDHPRILISALFIDPGKVGGSENYLVNLLKGLVPHAGKENIKLAIDSNLKYHPYLDFFDPYLINVRYNRRLYDLLMSFKSEYWNADVLFLPNYISPLFKRKRSTRVVTTFHDLQFFHSNEIDSWVKRIWLRFTYLHTLNIADKVICISQFVKDDLVDQFGKKYEHKIKVIPNPIDFDRFKHRPKKKEFDYILSVNALYPNKNTISLIKAYKVFKRLKPEMPKLVLVGQLSKNLAGNDYSSYGEKILQAIDADPDILLRHFRFQSFKYLISLD